MLHYERENRGKIVDFKSAQTDRILYQFPFICAEGSTRMPKWEKCDISYFSLRMANQNSIDKSLSLCAHDFVGT